jgi:hypothetical protein
MSLVESLKDQLEKRIASWNTEIEAAEARAKARHAEAEADAASAEFEQELWAKVRKLKQKVSEGKTWLEELPEAGEDRLDRIREKLRKLMD